MSFQKSFFFSQRFEIFVLKFSQIPSCLCSKALIFVSLVADAKVADRTDVIYFFFAWASKTLKAVRLSSLCLVLWKVSPVAWFEKWNLYFGKKKKKQLKPQNTEAQTKWRLGGLLQSHVNKFSFVVAKTFILSHMFSSYLLNVLLGN